MIYHFALKEDLEKAKADGLYTCSSLETEGFIHFSYKDQIESTGKKHCSGIKDLFLLEVSADGLEKLKEENGYPHLYSPLPMKNVIKISPISF